MSTAIDAAAPPRAARCFHCGDLNPPGSRWHAEIDGARAAFCCAGCLAVAQTIGAAGLASFYALRQRDPIVADPGNDAAIDLDAIGIPVDDLGDGTSEVALLVDGLRCGACVWLIETWLARQAGVVSAGVNFATRRARVRFRQAETSVAGILRAIVRIGYRAHPYDPQRREALARKEGRTLLLRTALALLGMMQVMMFAVPAYVSADGVDAEYRLLMNWASLVLSLPLVVYCAAPFFAGAWRDLRVRRPGMDVPIALGIGGAFAASAWATIVDRGDVYFDSVTMFVALVLVARLLEFRVREKAGDALEALARDAPQTAQRLLAYPGADVAETIPASALLPGDLVRVNAGASMPADGTVIDGHSSVEEAILTGESWPRAKSPGAEVMAGSVNRDSPLVVQVTKAGENTTLAALARLVERAASHRPRVARLADRVAAMFVAGLLALAMVSAIVWGVLDPARAIPIALAVLVVSCPCALSLATPAALAAAAGALSRRQILCVRADAVETLSRVTHVVVDKTGTLTTGRVRVTGIARLGDLDDVQCRALAAALEQGSAHPIAQALRTDATAADTAHDLVAVAGQGVEGTVSGRRYRLGRIDWVAERCAKPVPAGVVALPGESVAALASETGWVAILRFGDALRPDARALVCELQQLGLRVSLLSGDRNDAVAQVAKAVGIDDWHAEATPDAKRAFVARLQRGGAVVAMIGDGINDAPSLAQADVSMALGSAATLTQWTADAVMLGDALTRVGFALRAARRTFRVIRQNMAWALAYNAVAIPLAATGHLSPLAAAVGMSVSSLVVVGNAWRLTAIARRPECAAPTASRDAGAVSAQDPVDTAVDVSAPARRSLAPAQ